jgi:transposase, IS5 family
VSNAAKRQLSFADWEVFHQGFKLDPCLQAISDFLDDNASIIDALRSDLSRGLKNPNTGRPGLTPEQVLRSLILKRMKNWNYRELRDRIDDGFSLRKFTEFYAQPVPEYHAFNHAFNRLTPKTLKVINDLIVKIAVDIGLEDGTKLRGDTTVVQTDIHHPTDNTLLWDVVRVVTRTVGRLSATIGRRIEGFHNRTRAARRRMQEIQRMTSRARKSQQTDKYRALIAIADEVVTSAQVAIWRTGKARGKTLTEDLAIAAYREAIAHYCKLGDRVIDQSRRRVLEGEQVPDAEKIYSIFEPHTDLIKRGKVHTPLEFGHKVFLAESANGLITQYEVLDGNPNDHRHVEASLKRHKETFGNAPEVYGLDRGFFSEENIEVCEQRGVTVVSIPQRGGVKTAERQSYERSPAFKEGQRFRAGIEGRISVLFRGRGMKRCLAEGRERFELWVGAAVLANNLMKIAELKNKRTRRRRRPAAASRREKSHNITLKRLTRRLR